MSLSVSFSSLRILCGGSFRHLLTMETQAVSSSAQHAAATGRVQVEAEIPKVAPQPTPKECTYVRPFKDAFCHAGIYELRANEALSMYVEVLK